MRTCKAQLVFAQSEIFVQQFIARIVTCSLPTALQRTENILIFDTLDSLFVTILENEQKMCFYFRFRKNRKYIAICVTKGQRRRASTWLFS